MNSGKSTVCAHGGVLSGAEIGYVGVDMVRLRLPIPFLPTTRLTSHSRRSASTQYSSWASQLHRPSDVPKSIPTRPLLLKSDCRQRKQIPRNVGPVFPHQFKRRPPVHGSQLQCGSMRPTSGTELPRCAGWGWCAW